MPERQTSKRRRELAELLIAQGSVQTGQLASQFGVSRETIRKDLVYLEKQGIGKKERGGSMIPLSPKEISLEIRSSENIRAKQDIALAADKLIKEHMVVLLDSGSTTYEIARLLSQRRGLTIITNSATIPPVLSRSPNTVLSLGGEMRGSSMAYVGMLTLNALQALGSDIAFVATDGFYHRNGPCTSVYLEAEIKKAMVQNARETVLVCDSSKFQRDSVVQFCDWSQIDYLITDSQAPKEELLELEQKTKIILASTQTKERARR